MLNHLVQQSYGVILTDSQDPSARLSDGREFPYVSDGVIDLSAIASAEDYIAQHRNIKRKIKGFINKGGTIETQHGPLDTPAIAAVSRCIDATAAKSLIYSPFQDIFPQAVRETCRLDSTNLVHFIARMRGEFLGYHTFLKTGDGLRMLHGAFDRTRDTTFHAYENLIIETVRYATARKLAKVYFGPIMNETKRRMMNTSRKSVMFFYSDKPVIKTLIPLLLPYSRFQRRELLAFAE